MQPRSHRTTVTAPRGFTLVELLLGLAITALIGLGVAMMLGAIGAATRSSIDIRRQVIKRQVAVARLGSLTRSAAMVLAYGDDHLVLWTGDRTGNGVPDLSELRRIEWDQAQQRLLTAEAPDDLNPAADITYDFDDSFNTITAGLAATAVFPQTTTLEGVTAWAVQLDEADAQSARAVQLQITVDNNGVSDTAVIMSSLRLRGE